ncbi:3-isopropylmalate dehydratase large subunit [Marinobacter pelagius]|uniref:3-isopropylmalate dehydratase large subunit n=1 Tax=Marinobacter sp. C7 TaxID=2951363 RepID=UPI001EF0A9E9|nr:3-isopropylmalate dehydratase large subunit [Marinobacter sp. C7]MCG7198706.1 3-isopropylmalate dehydratase large subunit [Marinobacter sp. C7]
MSSKTLYDKLWNSHCIDETHLYIDRHLLHEVTSPQAFSGLQMHSRPVWNKDSCLAVPDHAVPTRNRNLGTAGIVDPVAKKQVERLSENCLKHDIKLIDLTDNQQGIVHVVGPELGFTLPGTTIVCGDSHTSTHGAFATLAMGIGSSNVEHVLATQTLKTTKLKTMAVRFTGTPTEAITPKDLILKLISTIGTAGATGYALEYMGHAITNLSMEGRMTICNMSIEAGATAGIIGYDATTESYLMGIPRVRELPELNRALEYWRTLRSDENAQFDKEIEINLDSLESQVTWGTSPETSVTLDTPIPKAQCSNNTDSSSELERSLEYMGLYGGQTLRDLKIDSVFVGSCTNARIEDLRIVAEIVQGRTISPNLLYALVVPGSGSVRRQAEKEGLDLILQQAGFEWRSPGCSMCLGMNDDNLPEGSRCASTSNRNFEGRQGKKVRTHLLSPRLAAYSALAGKLTDKYE